MERSSALQWGAEADPEQIMLHLRRASCFLRRYELLWRAHVVDFFLGRLWEIVAPEWLAALQDAPLEDLLLLPSHIVKETWPQSLKDFLREAQSLAVLRDFRAQAGQVSGLRNLVQVGMNSKKLHEIELLSSLIANIARTAGATDVVDVGAGQGYLAQALAFCHALPVTALDCSAHNTSVTVKRAERIRKYCAARSPAGSFVEPTTVTCRVVSEKSLQVVLSSLNADATQARAPVLVGLHACGDLSSNMLRAFVECKNVKAVVSVGCCYNLLSEGNRDSNCGYPLSKGVQSLNLHLGGAGRDLGCQSADRWKGTGVQMAFSNFKLHAFRAAFQIVLHRFYPEVAQRSPSVGRIGKTKRRKQRCNSLLPKLSGDDGGSQRRDMFSSFREYTASALARLQLADVPMEQLRQVWYDEAHPFVSFIGPFWSLRTAIAPVIETLLLLDRLLYLKEKQQTTVDNFRCMLSPVFDPSVSPRNMAIVAIRH